MSKIKGLVRDGELSTAVQWLDIQHDLKSKILKTTNENDRWQYQKAYEGFRYCFEEAQRVVDQTNN